MGDKLERNQLENEMKLKRNQECQIVSNAINSYRGIGAVVLDVIER